MLLDQVLEDYENQAPKAMSILEAGFEDDTAILHLPEKCDSNIFRSRIRHTPSSCITFGDG
jgi:hypothetical protein